ncbi:DNA protecting protein DprA [Wolbachia pipientis]|uniref:DNA protecting protein DprA n=1 Tax=Wolbachia pipientis TaxID=955 RepID=A0A1E7QKN9_WOLPI|nr:DNA-processing protein DprA [Wolbachia pipientis]OEY87038.1 DNA protecting protein DprA [Wolbachia pipientis]
MKISKLSNEELEMWLIIARTVGAAKFFTLLKEHKSPDQALQHLDKKRIFSVQDARNEIENTEKINAKTIPACDPDYPDLLRNIPDCPPVITALGNTALLNREIIAIIGGRNSSMNGRKFANNLALDLSKIGLVIVSGLARGIDTAANSIIHQGYPTIAVMASGIDVVYPKENLVLYSKIAESGGLVITELPFATQPKPQYFPQRNRIISGLSLGVVVIEASKSSGSLITANFALNQGREVFAAPGFPLDPRCSGSNYLIKNGAKLIDSAEDITESIRFSSKQPDEKVERAKSVITDHINSAPVDVDELILASGLPADVVLTALSELEMENKIERLPGNKISLNLT